MPAQRLDLRSLRGKFVVFDGPDGSGKSTVLRRVAERLRAEGLAVTECKDPGGTKIGDRIRSVLLDHDLTGMDVRCETLLFMASRAQLVSEVVRPALQEGRIVLCDRFVSATCAYQAAAGHDVDAILDLADRAVGTTWPDLTLILDVPYEVGFARIDQRGNSKADVRTADAQTPPNKHLDSMERRPPSFHEAVRANFRALPKHYPRPVEIIDATAPLDQVVDQALSRLTRPLG